MITRRKAIEQIGAVAGLTVGSLGLSRPVKAGPPGKRFMVMVLLPEGADDSASLDSVPAGSLLFGDWVRNADLQDKELMEAMGQTCGKGMHRAIKAGRGW